MASVSKHDGACDEWCKLSCSLRLGPSGDPPIISFDNIVPGRPALARVRSDPTVVPWPISGPVNSSQWEQSAYRSIGLSNAVAEVAGPDRRGTYSSVRHPTASMTNHSNFPSELILSVQRRRRQTHVEERSENFRCLEDW